MLPNADTIAAISTPPGPGAIGILRLSGPRSVDIAQACFRPLGKKPLAEHPTRSLVYGDLLDRDGQPIDRVLCTFSRGPASYTGEDTAEFQCHGSPMVLSLGLEALFAQGARQARAGEFTRRAFLNGRLDLAQAEAVGDLLEARSREGARHAAGQLTGALSRKISAIYSALVDIMAHFHAVLDYPDEDIDPFRMEELSQQLTDQEAALRDLAGSYRRGQYIRDGVPCAIVGRPNAGKSSLLNALVGFDRAIVTNIPGTTRDTVEERAELGGVTLRLIDTAGLRDSDDPIEQLGVERSRAAMEEAALVLLVVDGTEKATREDAALARQNLAENGLEGAICTGDLRAVCKTLPAGGFSLAISNPPYFKAGSGGCGGPARMEGDCALEDWCAAAGRLLKNGGRFALVHRPERLCDLFAALRSAGLEPKRLRLLQHGPDCPPSAVLLEAVRQGRPGLEILPTLLSNRR